MPSQNRGFHSISGLWPLSAVAAFLLLIPTLALGQEERATPRAVPRVPIYDPGTPVQKKVLKNGVTILVQEQRTSERVAGAVAARMGTVYESDDDAGRGQVLIKAMIAGTQKLKPVELALRLLAADAKLEAGVGPDLGQIAITTKREQVDQAIDLLSQVVLEPAFPDTAVDASRQRALTLAADENENPLKAAYSMYLASMFRGSPLARPVSGTVSGIADCRKKDLVALHQKYFAGGNMVVAFVGNFDGKRVMDQLEKAPADREDLVAPGGRHHGHHRARHALLRAGLRLSGAGLHRSRLRRVQDHRVLSRVPGPFPCFLLVETEGSVLDRGRDLPTLSEAVEHGGVPRRSAALASGGARHRGGGDGPAQNPGPG